MRRIISWFISTPRKIIFSLILLLILLFLGVQAINFTRELFNPRNTAFLQWLRGDSSERAAMVTSQQAACPGAPFILPVEGFIGLLYEDPRGPYSQSQPHQGIDIFSPDRDNPGLVPVFAAYDGYITRESNWQSTLILRIPEDPLDPNRQIWLYYTHMADEEGNDFIESIFSKGTQEKFVKQGTLLGYTGNYNGVSQRNIWVHLHFSIVKDDGAGNYLNELEFNNTLDPSPYLGMSLNYACETMVMGCTPNPTC